MVAVSVGASYDTGNRGPALFYLHGVPAAGTRALQALLAPRSSIRDDGISAEVGTLTNFGVAAPRYTSATR